LVISDGLDEPLRLQEQVGAAIEANPVVEHLVATRKAVQEIIDGWPPAPTQQDAPAHLSNTRRLLERAAGKADAWAAAKCRGADALPEAARPSFERLRAWCAEPGIFIVPVGKLESWLVPHGLPYPGNKANWIVQALQKVSELSPNEAATPWSFVIDVHGYLLGRQSISGGGEP
jgi:hypothetical protein